MTYSHHEVHDSGKNPCGDTSNHEGNQSPALHHAVHETWGPKSPQLCPPQTRGEAPPSRGTSENSQPESCGNKPVGNQNNGQELQDRHRHRYLAPEQTSGPIYVSVDASPNSIVRTSSFAAPGQLVPSETVPANPAVKLPSN